MMKTSKGPWFVTTMNNTGNSHDVICVKGHKDNVISVNGVLGIFGEQEAMANAALIAVAPDMLDALIAIQETCTMAECIQSQPISEMISEIFSKLANEAGVSG